MSLGHATVAILAKELKTEFRSRELLGTTIVFVLIVLVLFSFTFDPTSSESRRFGPGLLWLAFLFAGSLMLQPSFLREQTNDTLAALRLAPIDPFSILAGKMAANFLFLLLVGRSSQRKDSSVRRLPIRRERESGRGRALCLPPPSKEWPMQEGGNREPRQGSSLHPRSPPGPPGEECRGADE